MGIYDNDGKRERTSVRLTPFQKQKLHHVCQLFGITEQRFFADCVDAYYMNLIDVQSGHVDLNSSMKMSMLELLDDLVKLKQLKGIIPTPYTKTRHLPAP